MEFTPPEINLLLMMPVLIVIAAGTLTMILDLALADGKKGWFAWLAIISLLLSLGASVSQWGCQDCATFTAVGGNPMVLVDNFAIFLNITFALTGIFAILIAINYLKRVDLDKPEYYMLLLFSTSGMMLMGMGNDLILIFLALEVLSIPLYILSGFAAFRLQSEESAMKYFLLGAFSSAIFVFGIVFLYGASGSTSIPAIFTAVNGQIGILAMAGLAFVIVGAGFKIAIVPFHMWTPDVYEGAPTAVTAFMSVGAKAAGFAALLRVLVLAMPQADESWMNALAIFASLTLIVGNVVAIRQTNIKRMLAYSSIAHAGYVLIGVVAATQSAHGIGAVLFYLFAYLFTNLGAFGIVIAREHKYGEGNLIDDFKGLAKRSPLMALAMAYFMLSFTGVPPTGGFSGKFYIFRAALEADLLWLAIIGIITSVISGYYYLRIVYLMYMFDGEGELNTGSALKFAVYAMVIATLFLGLFPGGLFDLTLEATIGSAKLLVGG